MTVKAENKSNIYEIHTNTDSMYGGGGGGSTVDAETKNYVDAKMESVSAKNDARFNDVLSKLQNMNPATWWQNGLLLAATVGFVFAILAYASDRFDSGVASMGAIEERLDFQRELNETQNQRIDRLIGSLEQMNANSEASTTQQD